MEYADCSQLEQSDAAFLFVNIPVAALVTVFPGAQVVM